MPVYDVTVSGCDDSTKLTIDLTPEQSVFLTDIAEKVTAASTYGCEPRMYVNPHVHDEDCPEDHQ